MQRFAIGESGGWDYLAFDAATQRLFIPRGDRVLVMDAGSGQLRGAIPGTDGVHGVIFAPALNKGFTSDGKSNTVTVFALDSLRVRGKIPLDGRKPDALLYDPASRQVFVFNGASNNVGVIDPVAERQIATIALDGNPEFAVADGAGRIYVNIENHGTLTAIDSMRLQPLANWSLGDCEDPTGLALDAANHLTFSTCQNQKMVVLDVTSGRIVAELPIGNGPDAAAFDAGRGLIYSSNGDGTLSVYHEDDASHFRLLHTIDTQRSARTMALDTAGRRVFLAAAEFGSRPKPSPEEPRPRPPMAPGSFTILVVH